jgi:hypothetical protein
MPDLPEPRPRQKRLSKTEREEIRKALDAGDKAAELAERYGVSRQAISLIKRAMDAERGDTKAAKAYAKRLGTPRGKLTEEQWAKLTSTLKSSRPKAHGLEGEGDEDPRRWTLERAKNLAGKLFNKVPYRNRLAALLVELFPGEYDEDIIRGRGLRKPKQPKRITKESISPEFRDDQSYVDYVTSETYWKIQQRTYEAELAEYERRKAGLPPSTEEEEDDFNIPDELPPLPYPMKKKKKGAAFTKPKRRKKGKKGKRKR